MLQTLKKPAVRKVLLLGLGVGVGAVAAGRFGRPALGSESGEARPIAPGSAGAVLPRLRKLFAGLAGSLTDRAAPQVPGSVDRVDDGRSRIPTPAELAARVAANEGRSVVAPG